MTNSLPCLLRDHNKSYHNWITVVFSYLIFFIDGSANILSLKFIQQVIVVALIYIYIYKWVEKVDSVNPTKKNCRLIMFLQN